MIKLTGARSAVAFHNCNGIPHPSSLTYEAIFSENYFHLQHTTDLVMDVEISHAQVINPITGQIESWLGILPKSKYDGVGLRQPIDIALTLDISGSMGGDRIALAKQAIIKLFGILDSNDYISFLTFNNEAHRIFNLKQANKITQQNIEQINQIQVNGGTTLYNGLKDCYDSLKLSNNFNRRIIFITDMEDNCNDDQLIQLMQQSANEGIYVTFIGISYQCNISLTEALAHVKGSNYFVANKNEEVEKYLVNDFKYLCFPTAQDVELEFRSNNFKAIKCVGTGFNIPKEQHDECNKYKYSLEEFKKKISFLLMYFQRINKRLPIPVLVSFSSFLRFDKKTVCDIKTVFPSGLLTIDNKKYVEGGMILIKLEKQNTVSQYECQIKFKYTKNNGENNVKVYPVWFNNDNSHMEYYSDQTIKNAICLNYYVKYCRTLMKAENCLSKKKNIDLQQIKEQFRSTIDESSEKVKGYISNNMEDNCKKKNCLNKIDDLIQKLKENIHREKEYLKKKDQLL